MATEQIDFTHVKTARIVFPGNDLDGATGRVEGIVFAYPSWPCDLLYLKLRNGPRAGQTIAIRANLCEAVTYGA